MDVKQYNKILKNYNRQIDELVEERRRFVTQNKELVEKQIKEEQAENKKWFIENFDIIWENRAKFSQNTPNADIIIDFFTIYNNRRNVLKKISIADFISLWNIGFMYNGCPIVEYILSHELFKRKISYIKNNKLVEEYIKYDPLPPIVKGVLEYISSNQEKNENENDMSEYQTIADMKAILAV